MGAFERRFGAARLQGKEMANAVYEIPDDLRDFARRSVNQARKAFEGLVEVGKKTAATVDPAANEAQAGSKDASSQVLGFAEQNVNAALELALKSAQVKDTQEAIAVESEFVKTQLNALQNETQQLGKLVDTSAAQAGK
jgi:phasin